MTFFFFLFLAKWSLFLQTPYSISKSFVYFGETPMYARLLDNRSLRVPPRP